MRVNSADARAHIPVTPAALRTLMKHPAGSTASEVALVAAGHEWGYRDEQLGAPEPVSPRARLVEGLKAVGTLKLAEAVLDEFNLTPREVDCRVTCRFRLGANSITSEERICHLLAAGYLSGWVASMTQIEVACESLSSEPGSEGLVCVIGVSAPTALGAAGIGESSAGLEEELSELGLGLNDLVEMTLDTIVFLDSEGIVRLWNPGATRMFGYERSEVMGRKIDFLIPRDLLQSGELDQLRAACRAEGIIFNHITRRLHKDGKAIWVSLNRTVSRGRDGNELGVVATMRDITAQRDREQELERARSLALVGELAAKVAHEVKNPLAGIYAALQVLEGQLEATDPSREIFDSIGEEVMRLNKMTQELLNFARPPEPQLVRADLKEFLVNLVEDLERLSIAPAGKIECDGLGDELSVCFDFILTGQLFKNLILNGLQAAGPKGALRLSSHRHRDNIAIDVADTGPGIKKASHASIFEPFFTTKSRGTGLGLSIAKKNIEAQGGTIRLRSHRGRGAIFRVEFPTGG